MHRTYNFIWLYLTHNIQSESTPILTLILYTQQKPLKRTQEKCCMLAIRKQRARRNIIRRSVEAFTVYLAIYRRRPYKFSSCIYLYTLAILIIGLKIVFMRSPPQYYNFSLALYIEGFSALGKFTRQPHLCLMSAISHKVYGHGILWLRKWFGH